MTTSAASRPARHACSDKYLMSGILDQINAEERRLLKFARRYTIDLPRAREAAILARPRCALGFGRPAVGDIVDQVRGVPQRHPRAASSTRQLQKNGVS